MTDVTLAWSWEGNVVDAMAKALEAEEWTIVAKADTRSKARGIDLQATRAGRTLLVEVKGYPSSTYRDPRRAGQPKRTNPANQAQQWYAHALLKGVRLQGSHPDAIVAIGLPDFRPYRTLFAETRVGLTKLGLAMLMLREDGQLEVWGLPSA